MKRGKRLLLGLTVAAVTTTHVDVSPTAFASVAPAAATAPLTLAALQQQGRNSLSGNVFGESRRPVSDIYVELLSDVGMTISRTRTNGSGRYLFYNLPSGRFQVRVLPYGTDYLEQTAAVSLIPVSNIPGAGADSQQIDFYLRVKEGVNAGPLYAPGTLFVQEVPEAAKKLYDRGVAELRAKKDQEGFESLRRSLEIFPTYYDALDRLGQEYAVRGSKDRRYFEAARVLLTKSIEVNRNSFSSSFGLGFSQYHLGLVEEAIPNLQRAVVSYSKSDKAYLWLGIALKHADKMEQAEVALKRASVLSKGKDADAHLHLAQLYSKQKRFAEAVSLLETLLKKKQNVPEAEKIKQLIVQLKDKASKS